MPKRAAKCSRRPPLQFLGASPQVRDGMPLRSVPSHVHGRVDSVIHTPQQKHGARIAMDWWTPSGEWFKPNRRN